MHANAPLTLHLCVGWSFSIPRLATVVCVSRYDSDIPSELKIVVLPYMSSYPFNADSRFYLFLLTVILNAGENRQKTALDEENTFVNISGMYEVILGFLQICQ